MRNGSGQRVQYKDYVAGWLDSSIPDFLELLPEAPPGMGFALVTCLDSNLNPASLVRRSPELRSLAGKARRVGKAILLPSDLLLEANAKATIFHGFDEVWFFPSDDIDPKPDVAWLVGPRRVDRPKLRALGPWLSKHNCTLGLGDGEGLNVIVKGGDVAKHLVAHSLSQPQHAAGGTEE
jgi:hypothetical protein